MQHDLAIRIPAGMLNKVPEVTLAFWVRTTTTGGGSDWWAKIFANAPLILGIILIGFVLLVPKGLVPTLGDWGLALLRLRGRRATKRLEPTAAE